MLYTLRYMCIRGLYRVEIGDMYCTASLIIYMHVVHTTCIVYSLYMHLHDILREVMIMPQVKLLPCTDADAYGPADAGPGHAWAHTRGYACGAGAARGPPAAD